MNHWGSVCGAGPSDARMHVTCRNSRVTLIENFASRKTVKEKLKDRRIAEPPIDENSKKIRELTGAMRAEQDARIRNRMMAVRGIPHKGRGALRRRGPAHGPAVGGAVR